MGGFDVKVDIKMNTDKIDSEMKSAMKNAMMEVGLQAEGDVKHTLNEMVYDTPEGKSGYVRTGRLRGSITFATSEYRSHTDGVADQSDGLESRPSDEKSVYVGTNVEYAQYVHEGTMNMPPRRFLDETIQRYQNDYRDIIEENISDALSKFDG